MPQPGAFQRNLQLIAVSAWCAKLCIDLNGWDAAELMQGLEGVFKRDIKECFDAIIDHLIVAGKKHDASWVTVFEQYLLIHGKWHLLNPQKSVGNIIG